MSLKISAIIITKNEENNIGRCLDSLSFAEEILVVDSGSQDKTCQIASIMGARVLHHDWKGFGPQKRWATEQARHDWVISLDADEEVSPELATEIQQRFMELDPKKGYQFPRKSFFLGRWIEHGGWYPDRQLRLYNRQHSQWPDSQIHERVVVQGGQIENFKSDLRHYVFNSISDQVDTNNRYSGLLALADYRQGKRFSLFKIILKPWFKFFECYIIKFGFMDGFPGFIIAKNAAYSIFLRQIKLWEVERTNKGLAG